MADLAIRVVRRPYYTSVGGYWNKIELYRGPLGLPGWCFDFISIHRSRDGKFSLLGPSCLIGADSTRPSFENLSFKTFDDAKRCAKETAARYSTNSRKIHVVNCCK